MNACAHCAPPEHAPERHDPNTAAHTAGQHWLFTMVQELTLNSPTPDLPYVIIGSDQHSIWLAELPPDAPGIALLRAACTTLASQPAATSRRAL